MCYDINKYKKVIKKDELEKIDNITRVIIISPKFTLNLINFYK